MAYDGGSNQGYHLLAALDGLDNTHDVAALVNSAKGTGVAAGTAGYTFIVIDFSLAVIADADSTYAAGTHAGTMDFDNSAVGANLLAATTLNAFVAVDKGAVLHQTNSFLRAIIHALVRNAVTADIRNIIGVNGALVAGGRQHIDDGQILALRLKKRLFRGLDNVFLTFLA